MPAQVKYRRVLLKLSGESLGPAGGGQGVDVEALKAVVERIAPVRALGVELAIVQGGGNFVRARAFADSRVIRRVTIDYMGMLGTVINALALRDALESAGMPACVMSALPAPGDVCGEPVNQIKAVEHLTAGRIVIFAAGTGSPYLTTDTAAALRACEIGANVIVKATKVQGVYDSDPMVNPQAKLFDRLTIQEALSRRLGVMDQAAFSLCGENRIPIIVCQVFDADNLAKAVRGEKVGTLVTV